MTALVDTNVVLDVMLGRVSHLADSAAVLSAVERAACGGLLCATTITTIHFIAERQIGSHASRAHLARLLSIFGVAAVNQAVLASAIQLAMADFEDAVLHEAAVQARADCIVTRNIADFKLATLPVYTPAQFLAALAQRAPESER
jgi:predicted nucleic acid-binding protein